MKLYMFKYETGSYVQAERNVDINWRKTPVIIYATIVVIRITSVRV